MSKTAIILPAFNEEAAIAVTIRDFQKHCPDALFVVIDNASTDHTSAVAEKTFRELNCQWKILHEPRKGKGNAVRKAFREIEADIFVMIDADSTYLATDLKNLMAPVVDGKADLVVGNRHADSVYRKQNRRLFHDFGNGLVRSLINKLFKTNLQDIMSGYRVMSRRFVKHFPILSEGFEIETEMTLQAVDKRFSIVEVPIQYGKRPDGSNSKLNTYRDGMKILRLIFWIFKDYRPLVFFSLMSIVFAVAGIVVGTPVIIEFAKTGLVPKFPSAILATGLMTFSLILFAVGMMLDTVVKLNREQFELILLRDK
jgi:glycosyltransferase involved in cell wall biosynthesis